MMVRTTPARMRAIDERHMLDDHAVRMRGTTRKQQGDCRGREHKVLFQGKFSVVLQPKCARSAYACAWMRSCGAPHSRIQQVRRGRPRRRAASTWDFLAAPIAGVPRVSYCLSLEESSVSRLHRLALPREKS